MRPLPIFPSCGGMSVGGMIPSLSPPPWPSPIEGEGILFGAVIAFEETCRPLTLRLLPHLQRHIQHIAAAADEHEQRIRTPDSP
jgi:hypothetical protein